VCCAGWMDGCERGVPAACRRVVTSTRCNHHTTHAHIYTHACTYTRPLAGGMLLYLALAMTTTQYALRQSLDLLLLGEEDPPFTRRRQVALTALGIGSALAVALIAPSSAEKIISVVGATGVCIVSYIIPVAVQLRGHGRGWVHPDDQIASAAAARYYAWHQQGGGGGGGASGQNEAAAATAAAATAAVPEPAGVEDPTGAPLLPKGGDDDGDEEEAGGGGGLSSAAALWCGRCCTTWEGVVEPVLVLVIGVGFSVASLYVAVMGLIDDHTE